MPRKPRVILPGAPHHITQRGNRREDVFFTPDDRRAYLAWLLRYCLQHDLEILAYCLMTNHIHLVAVPKAAEGMPRVLRPLHTRYAQRLNRRLNFTGRVWQGRYFSSPLDERHMWAAIRYVERNPVRANLVRRGEDYTWSSAAAHCGLREDALLTRDPDLLEVMRSGPPSWSDWLAEGEEPRNLLALRERFRRGLPCGSVRFIRSLERKLGLDLNARPRGRPSSKRGASPF